MALRKRLALRERLVLRERLARWLRRLSARAARAASALDQPASAPAPEVRDGPPEHWLRLVAERAPELLEGRGIRFGMPDPPAAGKMPPMPDVSRPSPAPPVLPVPRRADVPAGHRSRPGGQDAGRVVDSWPEDRHRAAAGDRPVSGTIGSTPARAAVLPTSPDVDLRRAGPGTPQKWLNRLIIRARPKAGSSSPEPPRVRDAVEARQAGTPVVGAQAVWTAPMPVSPGGNEPPPRQWEDPPAREPGWTRLGGDPIEQDYGTADAQWPRPPSGGSWPWAGGTAGTVATGGTSGDRWPALPDDSPLWTTPASLFTDDRVRRLDAEQRGL